MVPFRYIGKTSLSVDGVFSGREYHFDQPGAIVAIDLRDQASLASVPILQQVETP